MSGPEARSTAVAGKINNPTNRQPEVAQTLDDLRDELNALDSSVSALVDRLLPVLHTPVLSEPSNNEEKEEGEPGTDIGKAVKSLERHVRALQRMVNSAINRLAI